MMEGLEKLKEGIGNTLFDWITAKEPISNLVITAQILTLFQDWLEKEIGKLKVIGDKEIAKFDHRKTRWDDSGGHYEGTVDLKGAVKAQLDDVKKHFKEMK